MDTTTTTGQVVVALASDAPAPGDPLGGAIPRIRLIRVAPGTRVRPAAGWHEASEAEHDLWCRFIDELDALLGTTPLHCLDQRLLETVCALASRRALGASQA